MDVADLSAGPMSSCQDLSVDDDSAAYASPKGHCHKIPAAFSAALPHLAKSRYIGIVAGTYMHAV